jgi:hypothetical protein
MSNYLLSSALTGSFVLIVAILQDTEMAMFVPNDPLTTL